MKRSIFLAAVLICLLMGSCGWNDTSKEELGQDQAEERCREIQAQYQDLYETGERTQPEDTWDSPVLTQSVIDAIEDRLGQEGLGIVDSHERYPGYLTTADSFRTFLEDVEEGRVSRQEVLYIQKNGDLYYQNFYSRDGELTVESLYAPMSEEEPVSYESHAVQEWTLTERGNFYYRIYPADDPHYADFSLLRLTAPDPELWDLNLRYVGAGSYIATNVFLTDWWEDDLQQLSFNDLWEHLYYTCYGRQFPPGGYVYHQESHCYDIPAGEFEAVILPFFNVDLETFRQAAQYQPDTDSYPWRPMEGDDHTFLHFYTIEPEVTAYRENGDGTLTLTVELLSTDLKTDCLFAHELTVRPMEGEKFQFVENRVTFQTEEYGLPFCEPRLTWGEMR